MEPDRISLSYVVHCLHQGKNLESDSAEPGMDNEFPRKTDFFVPLIQALQAGEIEARGTFSRVRLDHPEIDEKTTNAQLLLLSADFRVRRDIVIGVGKEAEPSNIPSAAWWYEGAIWEKSALWVNDKVTIGESRWRGLKIERTTPFPPERPYDFEELNCFDDVTLNLSEALSWADDYARKIAKTPTKNTRNAGRKPSENWAAIEAFLAKAVDAGSNWVDWNDVWHSLLHLRKDAKTIEAKDQPYRKLVKRLEDHNPELLRTMRQRIGTSRA